MDAKDLRTEAVLGERSSDGTSKYSHMGTSLPCSVNKNYPEVSSNPLAKVDTPTSRPCAVIGPDRVLPPPTNTDAYLKKSHYEPWPPTESTFRHPPEYPHKTYQSPVRNISPRQTFQENMQRIMVAPTYNTMKMNEESNFGLDRNASLVKNKLSGSAEPKYCDVPYSINHLSENQKSPEMCVSNVNNARNCPPIWHPSGVNMRPTRPYAASELYQFPDYASCAVPRPMTMARTPHRTVSDESSHLYSDGYYHHGNVRFKPYPNIKERYPQARYEYVNNYPNPFHPPPPFPPHKYDLHKPVPSHPAYPQVPMKYLENRMNDPVIDGYQRSTQQINYNAPYQNQMLHPAYGSVLPNSLQSKLYPYPQDKTVAANKLPYENNNKMYLEFENSRNKGYPDNFYVNDISRNHMKSQVIIPNYPSMNLPPHSYYRKDGHSGKGYDYMPHFRNVDPNTIQHLTRMAPQFSPNGIAFSPSDSNTSNDTAHTHGNSLEDCGYVSQSSTASVRSIESGIHRIIPNDIHRRYNYGYPSMIRTSPLANKVQSNINHNISSKDKKGIDVRQFLQMWNEGDEENAGNSKETQNNFRLDSNKSISQIEAKTQDQLYVLGLVNVPSEELGKYEHIQKVSKLPENIKGYNNIELLKHFEEAIESSNLNNSKTSSPRNYQLQRNPYPAGVAIPARPISPLDVEAKISQSVIHKEVGCNFEIRPCSPEMLNVEVATPVQNILEERVIEKLSNPYQSPAVSNLPNNGRNCNAHKQDHVIMINENAKIPSCKLNNTQCLNSDVVNAIRPDYSLDLESNSGVCLASLPRLDNDIELNFPEVNQQFINDNKDSVIPPKDLQRPTEVKTSNYDNDENVSDHCSYKIHVKETEKEFSKLSKYRKNKKTETESKEPTPIINSQFLRTDSVIIKNPENAKYFEDSTDHSLNATNLEKEQNDVLNLSPTIIMENSNFNVKDNTLAKDQDNDMAIDFSLHKSKPIFDSKISIADEDNCKSSCGDNGCIDKNIQSNKNTTDNYDAKALTTSQSSTDNDDSLLTEGKNSSKISLAYNEESPSDKILGQDVIQQSVNNMAKDAVESVLCVTTLKSLNKNFEDGTITDDEEEIGDVRKVLANRDDHNERSDVETEKKEPTTNNTYSSCTDLVEADKINEKTNSYNELILVESEIQNKFSPKHANEHTSDSNDNIFMNQTSQDSDETCHLNNLEDSAYESKNVSFDLASVSMNNGCVFKSCNLKKMLFSPWIQKLLLKSDDSILKLEPTNENCAEMYEVYRDSSNLDSSNSSKSTESLEESNHSSNLASMPNNTGSSNIPDTCNNSMTAKDVCTIEEIRGKDVDAIEMPCTQNEKPANSGSEKCDENKNDPVNISEQNDELQPANNPKYITQVWDKNNEDKNSNILYLNESKKLTPSPNISTGISSGVFENDKKIITNITKPCGPVQPPNIARENLNEECFVKLNKDLESSEQIEICNSENMPDSMPTEDNENVCFPVQTKASESPAILKIALSKMCTEEHQTKLELNEQSLFKLTSTEDANEVVSQGVASESEKEIKTCQVQETVKTESIVKDVLDDSENLKSQNKIETESYTAIDVLKTEDSKKKIKELLDDSVENANKIESEMEGSIETINFENTHNNTENYDNKIEKNVDYAKDLNEISETKTDIIEVIQIKESEDKDEEDEDTHKGCEDFNKEKIGSEDYTETTKIIQILETASKEQKTDDFINWTDPTYAPNILESKSNISIDDCMNVNTEENVNLKNNEVMHSPKIPNDETMTASCNLDNNFFIINERKHTDKYFITSSSKPVIVENVTNIPNTQTNSIVLSYDQSPSTELKEICFVQNSSNEIKAECENNYLKNRRLTLKRSLSDSAIDIISTNQSEEFGNEPSMWSKRRRKNNEYLKICDTNIDTDNVCNFQSNRRNSISSVYNEENLSFCIVIDDDCIITQENEDKICFAEVAEDCFSDAQESDFNQTDIEAPTEMLLCTQTNAVEISEPFVLEISDDNAFHNSWVEDIGCVETVVSDDVAEDVTISAPSSLQDENGLENDHSDVFNDSYGHTDKVKHIYGGLMCNDDAEFLETLYRTPQMNVNKTLSNRESHSDDYEELDEYNSVKKYCETQHSMSELKDPPDSLDNRCAEYFNSIKGASDKAQESVTACEDLVSTELDEKSSDFVKTQDDTVNSCESSIDNVFLYNQGNDSLNFETQSSPEVSSTTSEEKCSSLLLKITNYKGTRTSQLNEINVENTSSNCCKFTENINYTSFNNSSKPRPLITKGAQKYIPPVIEPAGDLKVKLPLPQQSLLKLKQLKIAKTMPKQSSSSKINEMCKKPKPRFEDVLKSIDEIQFKMHKEKSKRPKKPVPKVVIKKSENGSHYASMPNNAYFNPDLTGRKWQPWVFIEKDIFIDKMAIKNKTNAIFSHRKNTYVLADKFQKYKSASSAKFIISQPKLDDQTMGHLKYTIRLKHTY